MYRVIAIVCGGLALAACSSMNLDALKPAPIMDTVRFESTPPGADAKTSNGQTCRTPCALALPTNEPLTVVFSLNGYQPESEDIEPVSPASGVPEMQPNPVTVELTPAPPPPKALKKPAPRKKKKAAAVKPAAKPKPKAKPKTSTAPAPAPQMAEPPPQQAPAPWPSTPPPRQ